MLCAFFDGAQIRGRDGKLRPLVVASAPLMPMVTSPQQKATPLTPLVVFGTLFAFCLLLSYGEWRARKGNAMTQRAWRIWSRTFDTVLLLSSGIVGVLLTIMIGWSEHPAVGTNYLITIFHPLAFLLWLSLFWARTIVFRKAMAIVLLVGVFRLFLWPISLEINNSPSQQCPLHSCFLVRVVMIVWGSGCTACRSSHQVARSIR